MTLQESLRRVLEQRDDLAATFYETFFTRHPEARDYFAQVDLRHQRVLLTMALMVVERHYTHGFPSTLLYLKYLGHKHHLRQVPGELYPKWVDSLLIALEQFHGTDWDAEAATAWRNALDRASEAMLAGYREPIHV